MEHARADLINAVLNSSCGQFASSQGKQRHANASSWGVKATQYQPLGSRENETPVSRQALKIDVQAAQRQVSQINAQIETRSPQVIKVEPEPEHFNMQSITVYQPASIQMATSSEPQQERVIPVYRPHLGPRSQFEKRYGLPPGGSYTAGRKSVAQSHVAEIKQEVVEEVKQEVKQDGDALPETKNGHPQCRIEYQAGIYAPPTPAPAEDGSAWSRVEKWSHSQQRPQAVKQEINASPEVTITTEYQIRTQATAVFPPITPNGLAASRYASGPHPHQRPATTQIPKNEAAPHRHASRNTTQHVYGGQPLADPVAFMSAVNGESRNRQQTPQAPTSTPIPRAQPAPQPPAAKKPSPPQPVLPAKEKDTEYSDEVYTDFLGTKAYGNRYQSPSVHQPPTEYQSPSGWPVFPSPTPSKQMQHTGSAARWGNEPTVSVAMASPNDLPQPAPAPAALTLPANHAKSTAEWKNFANSESEKNKQPMEAVKFVPSASRWPNDDPPTPSPTKVPAPKLVAASKHHGYETTTPKQSTPAPSVAPTSLAQPNDKPLSEVVNADRIKIKALEAELEEQGSRLETIEQELEAYKEERIEMERELEAYRAESSYTKELRGRLKTLQAEYDALKVTKAVVAAPVVSSGGDDPRLEWLETRNRELQLEVHLKEPLFQIGKDVRTRYLEEARSSQLKVTRRELDKAAIERGNAAVYNGVSEADAAVLNGGFLTNLQLKNLIPVFKSLYGDDPKEFYKLSAKMREAMDAYATIQTSAALNSNHPNLPLQELKIIEGTVRLMGLKHNEMGTEVFEADAGGHAARALEKIKEAMVPCLKFDRKWDRLAVKEKLARDGNGSSTQSPEKGGAPVKQ